MNEEERILTGIEHKVRKLAGQRQALKLENENKLDENRILNNKIIEQQKIIEELEGKIKNLTIANLLESDKGTTEARARINELVREIDKCIGLLNN